MPSWHPCRATLRPAGPDGADGVIVCGDITVEVRHWKRDTATGDIVFEASRDAAWEAFLGRLLGKVAA